jgi:hypothetical protein
MRHRNGRAKYLESVTAERGRNMSQEIAAMLIGGAQVHNAAFGPEGVGLSDEGTGAGSPGGGGLL